MGEDLFSCVLPGRIRRSSRLPCRRNQTVTYEEEPQNMNKTSGRHSKTSDNQKLIAANPIAKRNYALEEVVESGIVLKGTEVKSLRMQAPNLRDAFIEVKQGTTETEAWLVHLHIGPYSHGNIWNHEATRRRKLLLHRHQLQKLSQAIVKKGMTIVPLRMYFSNGIVKLEIALGKGKKNYDKREDLKKKATERDMQVTTKRHMS